ncbi:hypothetical protein SCB29_31115 [Paraburkholderia sp. SIMBA_055]|uniref:hypothetical protein n=1 Tax=Paraburkholderia graminis TaxID=60548 RepID=UPI0012F4875C|nr:hypothetical protein [Paraburkholderia graminis]
MSPLDRRPSWPHPKIAVGQTDTYKNEAGRSVKARFIYLSHSDDPSQAGRHVLSVEKPDINYGIRDEENGGKYVTSFELTGWNRSCADGQHPKTFSGVAPESVG